MATLKPSPSAPTRADFGIFTSSKITSVVLEQRCPILSSLRPIFTPGVDASTTKQVMPLCFLARSKVAKTVNHEATPPLVIQRFCPFRMYSSPFFSTLVDRLATSEPASGSEQQ